MRKLLLLTVFMICFSGKAPDTDAFCEGWEDGYVEGFCYQVYGCLEPLVPLCPLPRLGEDGYRDGYNRGFIAGKRKRDE